jgi:circadian clock protein KaiC
MESTRRTTPTGIPGLDTLLGGGLLDRQTILITGEPGTGKTVACSQMAFAHAAKGMDVLFATVTSEPHDKLLDDLASFPFFARELIGGQLFLLSVFSALKKGPKESRDLLLSTIRDRRAKLLIFDGLRSVRDLWRDDALVREFLYELGVGLATAQCAAVFTTEYPPSTLMQFPEATTVDALISFTHQRHGPASFRRVEVLKFRGRRHLAGLHSMRIDDRGVVMIPRAEATPRGDRDYRPQSQRATFGLPELDGLMSGGLPVETTTLVAGSTGIGKTLLGLYFASEGAAQGEPSMFYSFNEPPGSLVARARRIGLDLQPLLHSGALRIEYPPPIEADADELAEDICTKLYAQRGKRLVVDGLIHLEEAVVTPERLRPYFQAFIVRLRKSGVTTVFTKQVAKIIGPELDFSDTPIAALAENLLLLRHVELRGGVHRVLSILNLRDGPFDGGLREFVITSEGLRVRSPFQSAEGLLTGEARPVGADPTEPCV